MQSVAFTQPTETRQVLAGSESHIIKLRVVGVAALEGEVLRLQYRVIEHSWRHRGGISQESTTEGEVTELLIPLRSLRYVRVAGPWWRPRLEIAASDLRALDGFPRAGAGEVTLQIRRRDRTDARELASLVEYGITERLLAAPDRM